MFRRRGWSMSSTRSEDGDRKSKDSTSRKEKDTKIRYYEDDPEATEVASRRRPRRHTADGPSHADAIQKAKQVVANGDPSGQYGTLDRKQLVSILKQRYGNDLEKYSPRGDKIGPGNQSGAGPSYQSNGQDCPVEDRYPMGQQRLTSNTQRQEPSFQPAREGDTGHQYYKIAQLHSNQPRVGHPGFSPSTGKKQYRTTTTTTTTVVRKGSDASHSSSESNNSPLVQTLSRSPRSGQRRVQLPSQSVIHSQVPSTLFNGHRKSTESMNSDGSLDQQLPKLSVDRILFLQLKDEIKRASMPRSISSIDTIKALFVTTFPGKISMPRLDEKGAIYIKDREAGVFYELDDLSDVQPKSHLKVHERSTSIESYDAAAKLLGSQQMASVEPLLHPWTDYPVKRQVGAHYAESLQDMPLRPRLERSGSGTSFKSDIPISRPSGPLPPSKGIEGRTMFRNQNWGVMEETVQRDYVRRTEASAVVEQSLGNKLAFSAASEPLSRIRMRCEEPQNITMNATQFSTTIPASLQTSVQASVMVTQSSPHGSFSTQSNDTVVETEPQTSVGEVPATLPRTSSKSITIPGQRKPPPPPPILSLPHDIADEPPTIPSKKVPPPVQPRNKAREDARRKLHSQLNDPPTSPTTVEEQLADLTELLHTALISDDEDGGKGDEEKRPGKLSQDLLDNLQALTEEISKSPPPGSAYQPTAILLAQRHCTDRASENEIYLSYDTNYLNTDLTARHYINVLANRDLGSEDYSRSKTGIKGSSYEADEKAPEKPPLPMRQSSKNATTLTKASTSSFSPPQSLSRSPKDTRIPSSPSSVTRSIDMVGCALSMKSHVLTLRSQLDELKTIQVNSVKQFKSFIGQAKNDFNGLVDHLNNNLPEDNELPVNFKSRRLQLQNEGHIYRQRVEETEEKLQSLEDNTENVRREVIQRKIIVDPENLETLGTELQSLSHSLAELRAQFSCLHDAMKFIMSGELEVIVQEERFLKEEPGKLDNLLARCKHLSGTIFTLQKLASVQQMSRSSGSEPGVAFLNAGGSTAGTFQSDSEAEFEGDKSVEMKQARVVRFKDQAF